jgi:hypothetical protein
MPGTALTHRPIVTQAFGRLQSTAVYAAANAPVECLQQPAGCPFQPIMPAVGAAHWLHLLVIDFRSIFVSS